MIKIKIAKHVTDNTDAHALFFVKKAIQFSSVLSENGEIQVSHFLSEVAKGNVCKQLNG